MTVAAWLARATEDAERRGLTELVPLLQTLARSTAALRAADAEFGHPATATEEVTDYTEHTGHKATDYTDKPGGGDGQR